MDLVSSTGGLRVERVASDSPLARHTLICADCGRETDTVPCSLCGRNPLLQGRYRLESIRPGADESLVYAASDLRRAGRPVAIRVVPLRTERVEAARAFHVPALHAFRQIQHPTIRSWSDAFLVGTGRARALGIVQPREDTPNLEHTLGKKVPASAVVWLMEQLLDGLVVLHGATPSLSCGRLSRARVALGGDDVPKVLFPGDIEQFTDLSITSVGEPSEVRAHAWRPATDVQRVAALAVCLLTGREESQLVDVRGTWDWERHTQAPAPFVELLRRWLSADADQRPPTACTARAELQLTVQRSDARGMSDLPTLDPMTGDIPAGIAAVRVPTGEVGFVVTPEVERIRQNVAVLHEELAVANSVPPIAAPTRARRIAPQQSSAPATTPEQPVPTAFVTIALLMLATVVVLAIQASLTSSGLISGAPWISAGWMQVSF